MTNIIFAREQKIKKFAKELAVLYEIFNWKWQDKEDSPTAKDVEETIYYLIEKMEREEARRIGTGGITVFETDFGIEIEWALTKSIYVDEQD